MSTPRIEFNLPNQLTLLRIVLTPVFVLLLLSDSSLSRQISLLVFIIAALTDWYDGWAARKFGISSRWGKFLDPLADKVLSSAALLAYASLGLIEGWMVWIVVVRDFLMTGLRIVAEVRDRPIVTSKGAQAKTFGQFVVIYYILILYVGGTVPAVNERFGSTIDALMQPQVLYGMMLLVTLTTVGTLVGYVVDNRKFLADLYRSIIGKETEPDPVPLVWRLIATALLCGYLPWASGTFGSLFGLCIALIPGATLPVPLAGLIIAGIAFGVPAAAAVARAEGHRLTQSAAAAKAAFQSSGHSAPDPSIVVIDEVVGMWVSLLFLPPSWMAWAIAFVLFRLMDILKPEPARYLERFPDGWGIMLDDVVAGVYANVGTRLLLAAATAIGLPLL
jgi:CDP-diacylglycerol---glycerol-3-phosphate 3-phosphatidyltransferase